MRRAIELSLNGADTTPPNPDVGCVILDPAGATVGEGWHERPGGPHAEINALAQAGERARGGTAVVTLEPCDHTGRTGPCTHALIAAGIARVVVAVADPNPVAAGGAATLRAHGIDVELGILRDEAAGANARWLTPFRTHRPFVVWKFAATLDGRSAAADGSSRWITGAEARADVHRLRAAVDTIVAGSGTVLADDPRLTARLDAPVTPAAGLGAAADLGVAAVGPTPALDPDADLGIAAADLDVADADRSADLDGAAAVGPTTDLDVPAVGSAGAAGARAQPLRVVVDSAGRTPASARVRDDAAPTWIATAAEIGATPDGRVDLVKLLSALYEQGRRYVLLEGGPTLAGAFWQAGLVDRVVGYVAPALLGAGPAALADAGVATIADTIRLDVTDVRTVGPDLRITATPREQPQEDRKA
ncbi:bifunctional diaminohydroxyphosphoribosylaminopyrimidine deaminase/5-amino-6-(5-phosphoribosylamino)uracil reductase RibD [Jiangella ureilytica]|uniref:Riboflavin biosynthesis protein RibD n=1 Tax=Jiangella ureilytica TaxID=2530374 RepID=A0A4R4RH02_9ACTN|nr:bifunctional diaminohydroxyphosphoribosylaminopyrimidine deaminase/5-amino-6-(5-phosphoribosylamino)uracil reductase RibD [Jiangella ureilytica]